MVFKACHYRGNIQITGVIEMKKNKKRVGVIPKLVTKNKAGGRERETSRSCSFRVKLSDTLYHKITRPKGLKAIEAFC